MYRRLLFSALTMVFAFLKPIGVTAQCNAAYNTIVTPGFTAVQFFDASTGANFWNWDFGDGTSSTQQNPVHNYASTGTYNVCLVIIGLTGCVDSVCQQVVVPVQGACTASFTVQPVAPGFPGFLFTGTGTGSAPLQYSWNFGDGTITPASPLNATNYIYQSPGTYNVCLTITDANNCTATSCQTVTYAASNCPPTFVANVLPLIGTVFFQDATIGFDPAVSWTWDFGDGTSASGSGTTTHNYLQSGSYNVCLSIVTQSGCTGSACSTIVVTVPGTCSASFTATASLTPLTFDFNPTVVPSTANQIWDFGDGSLPVISSSPVPQQHTYSAPGNFTVCLVVQDALCTDTFCTNITVLPTTGINDPDPDQFLVVYPNPAGESVRVELDRISMGTYSLIMTDHFGRIVKSEWLKKDAANGSYIDLSLFDIPSGFYGVRVMGENCIYSQKISVIR